MKGVVMNGAFTAPAEATRVGAGWFHRGGQVEPVYPGIESVPGFDRGGERAPVVGSSLWTIGYNEPDTGNPMKLRPEEAAELWRTVVEPRFGQYGTEPRWLIAPGVSHWTRWGGYCWTERWRASYRKQYGCQPQYRAVNVHGYSTPDRDVVPEFEGALAFAKRWGKQLWIGEYAALPSAGWTEAEMLAEAWRVIGWAIIHGVERLAWFNTRTRGDEPWAMDTNAPLYDYDSGALTAHGRLYAAWAGGGV